MFANITCLTSHIWSWNRRRSFSISSAISAPVISVRIIPCCLACSRFSFSIFVLPREEKKRQWLSLLKCICIVSSERLACTKGAQTIAIQFCITGRQMQCAIIHLQLGLVVFPCFVKGLLYVLWDTEGWDSAINNNKKKGHCGDSGTHEVSLCSRSRSCLDTTPLLEPPTLRVHDPVPRQSPQAQHKGRVYADQIYGFKGAAPFIADREETDRNTTARNLTPFTPFKSPFRSESRVKITLWLRLWSWRRPGNTRNMSFSGKDQVGENLTGSWWCIHLSELLLRAWGLKFLTL